MVQYVAKTWLYMTLHVITAVVVLVNPSVELLVVV